MPVETLKKKYIHSIYMKTRVTKWGNSYAIRLPKHLIDELNLADSELSIERTGKTLALKPTSKADKLKELLEKTTPQQETDWGAPRGKEAW